MAKFASVAASTPLVLRFGWTDALGGLGMGLKGEPSGRLASQTTKWFPTAQPAALSPTHPSRRGTRDAS